MEYDIIPLNLNPRKYTVYVQKSLKNSFPLYHYYREKGREITSPTCSRTKKYIVHITHIQDPVVHARKHLFRE